MIRYLLGLSVLVVCGCAPTASDMERCTIDCELTHVAYRARCLGTFRVVTYVDERHCPTHDVKVPIAISLTEYEARSSAEKLGD